MVLIDTGDFLVVLSSHIFELVIILFISAEDSELLNERTEELTPVFSFIACLKVLLINTGVLVDVSAHILDLVIILSISAEDSELLDEGTEGLTAVSSFLVYSIVVLINTGVVDLSAHNLDVIILLSISFEDSESLDESFEGLAIFLLEALTFFEDFVEELFCKSLGS